MGFVYRAVLSETIDILRKLHKTNIFGKPPRELYIELCIYIAPSSGHELLKLNLPFKLILKEVWDCFLMSGVRMLHFLKD